MRPGADEYLGRTDHAGYPTQQVAGQPQGLLRADMYAFERDRRRLVVPYVKALRVPHLDCAAKLLTVAGGGGGQPYPAFAAPTDLPFQPVFVGVFHTADIEPG